MNSTLLSRTYAFSFYFPRAPFFKNWTTVQKSVSGACWSTGPYWSFRLHGLVSLDFCAQLMEKIKWKNGMRIKSDMVFKLSNTLKRCRYGTGN